MSHTIFMNKDGVLHSATTSFCLGGGYFGAVPKNNILWVDKNVHTISNKCINDFIIEKIQGHEINAIVFCGDVHLCSESVVSKKIKLITFLGKVTFDNDCFSSADCEQISNYQIEANMKINHKLALYCIKNKLLFRDTSLQNVVEDEK